MKRIFVITVLLALVATSAFAQYAAVGRVVGTKHDLSSTSAATLKSSDFNQVCAFCHVAHKSPSAPATPQPPLWNHTLGSTITGTYSSSTFNALSTDVAALGAPGSPATNSHLCMGCHDGTIGVNSIYKFTATVGAIASHTDATSRLLAANTANLGTDLSGSHPVNFTYQGAAWLATQTHVAVPAGGVVSSANLPLFNDKLQCATCHGVHDNTNGYFLRDTLAGSKLCLDCHLSS